jgi:hypothetical protein
MSDKLKVFHVTCQIEIDMVVLAESSEHAERIGERNWHEEMQNAAPPSRFSAFEVTDRRGLSHLADEDLECVPPYGPDGIWENGCSSPQRSIAEYLRERGVEVP